MKGRSVIIFVTHPPPLDTLSTFLLRMLQALAGAGFSRDLLTIATVRLNSSTGVLVSPASAGHTRRPRIVSRRSRVMPPWAHVGGRNRCTSRDPWEGDCARECKRDSQGGYSVFSLRRSRRRVHHDHERSLRVLVGPPASPGWAPAVPTHHCTGRSIDRKHGDRADEATEELRGPGWRGTLSPSKDCSSGSN
jgi:hypothetical protein